MYLQPGPLTFNMADFDKIENVIRTIADGIEDECIKCLEENTEVVADCIKEQLYSGLDGDGDYLNPTYDNDPFFNEEGVWKGRAEMYKRWKERITPPIASNMLNLLPRPTEVPNLFITGTFHDSIKAIRNGDVLTITTSGFRDGPIIERKYGNQIFAMGESAKEYFNLFHLRPWLEEFFEDCGYK